MIHRIRSHPLTAFYLGAVAIASVVAASRYQLAVRFFEGTGEPANFYAIIWQVQERLGIANINVVTLARMALEEPAIWLAYFYTAAPTVAAIAVAWLIARRQGLAELFGRFRPWRGGTRPSEALRAYAELIGIFLGIILYFALVSRIHGGEAAIEEIRPAFGSSIWSFLGLFVVGTFLREGGLLEELGWRGFALPRLIERLGSPLNASILVGIMWSCWHIPRDAGTFMLTMPFGQYLLFLCMFTATLIALSIVITFYYHRTGGSVMPAIMIHCLYVQLSSGFAWRTLDWTDYGDFRSWLMVLLAFLVLWRSGPELGRRPEGAG
jgi:membrane protease YdiL (CAAX protease family)